MQNRLMLQFLCGIWPLLFNACSSTPEISSNNEAECMVNTASTITFEALFSAYDSQPMELTEDLYLLGYINSSDKSGNIFGSIFLQDSEEEPAYGLEIKTDLLETHARFPIGAQVRVSLKGLWLGKQGAGFVLGSQKDLFGVSLIDRLPALATLNHLEVTCWEIRNLAPRISKLDSLNPNWVHTLVQIQNLELSAAYTDSIFAQKHQETRLPLQTCNGKTISLLNSGFSDFQSNFFPQGSGSVTGILLGSPGSYELVLRSESDLEFDLPSCAVRFPPVTSDQLFISELADPDNEPQARFIEIFNSGETTLDLKGWTLLRYTNANTVPGAPAELTGLMLSPGAAAVISAWPEVFSETYGFEPDLIIRINGPADSNGDDNIVLLDPFGTTIDVFGIPGEDGTGTGHEYEDGAAVRSSFVRRANTIFTPAEWIIRNDSGGNGTENRPCYAPEDFTPGRHDLY